jgi:hypothetical protein
MNQPFGSWAEKFSKLIIQKATKWGTGLFVSADSDTCYVHSIIPYYGKLIGDMSNLPYSEKPFI